MFVFQVHATGKSAPAFEYKAINEARALIQEFNGLLNSREHNLDRMNAIVTQLEKTRFLQPGQTSEKASALMSQIGQLKASFADYNQSNGLFTYENFVKQDITMVSSCLDSWDKEVSNISLAKNINKDVQSYAPQIAGQQKAQSGNVKPEEALEAYNTGILAVGQMFNALSTPMNELFALGYLRHSEDEPFDAPAARLALDKAGEFEKTAEFGILKNNSAFMQVYSEALYAIKLLIPETTEAKAYNKMLANKHMYKEGQLPSLSVPACRSAVLSSTAANLSIAMTECAGVALSIKLDVAIKNQKIDETQFLLGALVEVRKTGDQLSTYKEFIRNGELEGKMPFQVAEDLFMGQIREGKLDMSNRFSQLSTLLYGAPGLNRVAGALSKGDWEGAAHASEANWQSRAGIKLSDEALALATGMNNAGFMVSTKPIIKIPKITTEEFEKSVHVYEAGVMGDTMQYIALTGADLLIPFVYALRKAGEGVIELIRSTYSNDADAKAGALLILEGAGIGVLDYFTFGRAGAAIRMSEKVAIKTSEEMLLKKVFENAGDAISVVKNESAALKSPLSKVIPGADKWAEFDKIETNLYSVPERWNGEWNKMRGLSNSEKMNVVDKTVTELNIINEKITGKLGDIPKKVEQGIPITSKEKELLETITPKSELVSGMISNLTEIQVKARTYNEAINAAKLANAPLSTAVEVKLTIKQRKIALDIGRDMGKEMGKLPADAKWAEERIINEIMNRIPQNIPRNSDVFHGIVSAALDKANQTEKIWRSGEPANKITKGLDKVGVSKRKLKINFAPATIEYPAKEQFYKKPFAMSAHIPGVVLAKVGEVRIESRKAYRQTARDEEEARKNLATLVKIYNKEHKEKLEFNEANGDMLVNGLKTINKTKKEIGAIAYSATGTIDGKSDYFYLVSLPQKKENGKYMDRLTIIMNKKEYSAIYGKNNLPEPTFMQSQEGQNAGQQQAAFTCTGFGIMGATGISTPVLKSMGDVLEFKFTPSAAPTGNISGMVKVFENGKYIGQWSGTFRNSGDGTFIGGFGAIGTGTSGSSYTYELEVGGVSYKVPGSVAIK